ncbi:MAG: MMPL family transporter [Candidatus Methanoplasma sp.]|jgi:RND superfamily putative drug exporter|nr:MMPL family transporter [Candidatus Methanoplasma sp.]
MPFEKLAEIILKRSKLIVVIWIVLLICAVPLAMKAGSVLDYDTNNMAGPDAESIEGAKVMGEYFHQSDSQMEYAVLLVAGFDTLAGKMNALGLYVAIDAQIGGYVDEQGVPKISQFLMYGIFTAEHDENEGVLIYAVMYSQQMIDEDLVIEDTPVFRDFIDGIISAGGITGVTTYVSGAPAISYDIEMTASGDMSKIDVFSILMILILVGLFFRSFVTSAMPPMTIGAAFGIVLCLMFVVGSIIDIIYMTEMMLLVSMLGAGCDYCIFILARYREERVHGADHELAVRRAVTWAGESITTSGLAVMIGFGAMSICSFSMISSMGVVLAMGIVVALLAALTLITSILMILGERLFWPTKMESLREGGKARRGWHGKMSSMGHRYFTRSVNASIKYAGVIIAAAVLFTIPAAYIMMTSPTSYDMVGAMSAGEGMEGLGELEKYSNGGMIMPNYSIFETTEPLGTAVEFMPGTFGHLYWNLADPDIRNHLEKLSTLSSKLSEDDNAGEVWGIYVWMLMAEKAALETPRGGMSDHNYTIAVYEKAASELPDSLKKQMLDGDVLNEIILGYEASAGVDAKYDEPALAAVVDYILNYVLATSIGGEKGVTGTPFDLTHVKFTVVTKDEAMSDRSMGTIEFMDRTMTEFAAENPDIIANTWLTGSAVVMYEISELVSSEFLKVELLAVALIFVLLFFVMKSYVTPIRSILTILMSVVWTVAVTHLIFGNLLGEGVMWMIPIILIVVCLGLGMDYDILLTTRIKENAVHRGMNNDDAIRYAVTRSGSVITICGLIMGGAFGTLMLSSTIMLQEFGFALSFAIIIDALLVRTYIVPAAMHLLGDWNWKGPKFLHKIGAGPPE